MQNQQTPLGVLRKVALFALLGFATITLFGPVVAVLSVVLSFGTVLASFALVGYLVWSAFVAAAHGPEVAWQNMRATGQAVARAMPAVGYRCGRVLSWPFRLMGRLGAAVKRGTYFTGRQTWAVARFAGAVAPVALTGVLVGVVTGVATGMPNHTMAATVPTDALFGGLLGLGVGVAMTLAERKAPVRQVSEGVS